MASRVETYTEGVRISRDSMSAWLCLRDSRPASAIDEESVRSVIEAADIQINEDVAARIQEYLQQVSSTNEVPEEFLIANRTRPVRPEGGEVEWSSQFAEQVLRHQGKRTNLDDLSSAKIVEQDAVVGRIKPLVGGEDGLDVCGRKVQPPQRNPLESWQNLEAGEDGSVVAKVSGRAVLDRGRHCIREILKIDGDVDAESKEVDAPCDVIISGKVGEPVCVKSGKSVVVNGAVEGAELHAAEDVRIDGGFVGRQNGKVFAGGTVDVKFCEGAQLQSEGNIRIHVSCVHGDVRAGKKILAEQAKLVGGNIQATRGVVVDTLGNDSCVTTIVSVGVQPYQHNDPASEAEEAAKIDQLRKEKQQAEQQHLESLTRGAQKLRQTLQPTMDRASQLSPAHKERVDHLLARADALEQEAKQIEETERRLAKDTTPTGCADVLVLSMIYPGTTITIDDRATGVLRELNGPVRIEKRKLKNVSELLAINPRDGSFTRLKSRKVLPKQV